MLEIEVAYLKGVITTLFAVLLAILSITVGILLRFFYKDVSPQKSI